MSSLGCSFFLLNTTDNPQQTIALVTNIISNTAEKEADFPVVDADKSAASIRYDEADWKGVIRAIESKQVAIAKNRHKKHDYARGLN